MKLRLYLDTSVMSALLDDRHPDRMRETEQFWELAREYEFTTSDLAKEEILSTPDVERRARMLKLTEGLTIVTLDNEARMLADLYIDQDIFSPALLNDALHVAAAVVSRQDILVSWNFRHLVNRRRRALVNEVNIVHGYPTIEIVSPPEI
ncbi:MAG: PIN domain-containing protein [Verrucomicrobia bacterium]|nr:PIN domain-containing protein [Verrucomicrobiota bacterium]